MSEHDLIMLLACIFVIGATVGYVLGCIRQAYAMRSPTREDYGPYRVAGESALEALGRKYGLKGSSGLE